jgi:hypothetical protein
MSVENTVFAANALSSGDATNEPATKEPTIAMSNVIFALLIEKGGKKFYKRLYGITNIIISNAPRTC